MAWDGSPCAPEIRCRNNLTMTMMTVIFADKTTEVARLPHGRPPFRLSCVALQGSHRLPVDANCSLAIHSRLGLFSASPCIPQHRRRANQPSELNKAKQGAANEPVQCIVQNLNMACLSRVLDHSALMKILSIEIEDINHAQQIHPIDCLSQVPTAPAPLNLLPRRLLKVAT